MKVNAKIKVSLVVIIVVVIIIFVFCSRQKVLGNMSNNIKDVQTSSSSFSFIGNEGDRLKISLRTTVANGTVDFVLSDSKGNVVLELDRAKALETFVDLSYDDTYTMTAIYNEFTGKYSIKVSTRRY